MSDKILIYTDGSCKGNPGPGGWGFLALDESKIFLGEGSGGAQDSTNNRMEMQAMIEALKWFMEFEHRDSFGEVVIISDSKLLINTLTKGWKKKANTDLWQDLDGKVIKVGKLKVKLGWKWIKAHAGHDYNEHVDQLAVAAAEKVIENKRGKRGSREINIVTSLPLTFNNEDDGELRNLLEESIFNCVKCGIKTAGNLSRKTATGPIRVDCSDCGKYVKFAKMSK